MLVYSQTWALGFSITSQWTVIRDILELPISTILTKCRKIYIEFKDTETDILYYYNIAFATIEVLATYDNLLAFLTYGQGYINEETLTTNFNPNTYQLVNYFNLFEANYTAKLNNNFRKNNFINPPKWINNNLIISNTHYPISNNYITNNCLITVNGFIHNFFINSKDDIEVINGGVTFQKLLNSQAGVLDFSTLGSITRIPITINDILTKEDLYTDIQLNVPLGFNSSTQTLMVVLGGYLTFLDDTNIYIDSDNILHINLSKLDFIDKYVESSLYLDLTSMIYENEVIYFNANGESFEGQGSYNQETGQMDWVITNDLILSYITSTPWFFVVLDNPSIEQDFFYPQISNFPGSLDIDIEPLYPFVTFTGRIIEYGIERLPNKYKVHVLDEILKHVVFVGANNENNNNFYSNWYIKDLKANTNQYSATAGFLKISSQV